MDLSEPMHFKGREGSGVAGGRCAYADASLAPRHDFEKYRHFYRLWGRLGYNPDARPETWQRALRRDFGPAATAVEHALASVSRVLPLFTQAHAPSANCVFYWPEIYTNLAIADKQQKHPYVDTRSPKLFGNVSPFDPQLFQSPDECAAALVAGRVEAKYSPLEVAQWLGDIAAAAAANIAAARSQLGAAAASPVFRRVEEDVFIHRGLALFFAGKLRAAVLWQIHALTGHPAAGAAAVASYAAGRDAWAAMAERAKNVYRSNISYGAGHSIHGHWADRLPAFDEDLADLRQRLAAPATTGKVDAGTGENALQLAVAKRVRPALALTHTPPEKVHAGQPLGVALKCGAPAPAGVTLHYRHVNQAERWQKVELAASGDSFTGAIPGDYTAKRYALQYYFEVKTGPAESTLFPPLSADLASVPYHVVRRAA
jgi:hypothetical protein